MSVHACNTGEILRAQRNKNYIIFMMTLSWKNYDIFKIPIAYFQFAPLKVQPYVLVVRGGNR